MALLILGVIGAVFGYWNSSKVTRRLEPMMETMILLEKGTFAREGFENGEDEIGRLGEQVGRIMKRSGGTSDLSPTAV